MNEQLIIRLPATPANQHTPQPVSWLVWNNSESTTVASGELADISELASLAERAKQRQVLVLVSSAAVGFHAVPLPAKSRRHLQQVVPYALEDELAEDIEDLHFCWPENTSKQAEVPVCVVRKTQMDAWLAGLAKAGIHANLLVPDVFLLPEPKNNWQVAAFAGAYGPEWVIRQRLWQGIVLEPELAQSLRIDTSEPSRSEIKSETSSEEEHALDAEIISEIVAYGEVQWAQPPAPVRAADPALPLELAANLVAPINLLQGEYRMQAPQKVNWGVWRFPALAASVLLGLLFINQWFNAVELEREAASVRAQYEAQYLQAFPNERHVVDIRFQLSRHVSNLTSSDGGQVLRLLNQLQPAFQAEPLQLTMLQYDHNRGELRMQANGRNFQTFERFTRAAREQNLTVEQGQLTSRAGQINGTIIVSAGAVGGGA